MNKKTGEKTSYGTNLNGVFNTGPENDSAVKTAAKLVIRNPWLYMTYIAADGLFFWLPNPLRYLAVNPFYLIFFLAVLFAVCFGAFLAATVLSVKKQMVNGVYICKKKKVSKEAFVDALGRIITSRISYIIWIVTSIPVWELVMRFLYGFSYRNIAALAAAIVWGIVLFVLMAFRKAGKK